MSTPFKIAFRVAPQVRNSNYDCHSFPCRWIRRFHVWLGNTYGPSFTTPRLMRFQSSQSGMSIRAYREDVESWGTLSLMKDAKEVSGSSGIHFRSFPNGFKRNEAGN